jgi:hypothetical protein
MSNYSELQKIIRKGKKIDTAVDLYDSLLKEISEHANDKNLRELNFLSLYYGLQGKSLTLEMIGLTQENKLTRERIRQIIDSAVIPFKENNSNDNPFTKSNAIFKEIIGDRTFIRIEELLANEYFAKFKKNIKGLISFLNDCNIRQIAYRNNYYLYLISFNRKSVVTEIQKENKNIRRENTLEKMSKKSKTVTYVPDKVREHLLNFSHMHKINLNPLYENILNDFIAKKPFNDEKFIFSRTKSWKARKGKAQWQQIGIYINKEIFDEVKENLKNIKKDLNKNVSLMSFICQSFVWHYENNS